MRLGGWQACQPKHMSANCVPKPTGAVLTHAHLAVPVPLARAHQAIGRSLHLQQWQKLRQLSYRKAEARSAGSPSASVRITVAQLHIPTCMLTVVLQLGCSQQIPPLLTERVWRTLRCLTTRLVTVSATPLTKKVAAPSVTKVPAPAPKAVSNGDRMPVWEARRPGAGWRQRGLQALEKCGRCLCPASFWMAMIAGGTIGHCSAPKQRIPGVVSSSPICQLGMQMLDAMRQRASAAIVAYCSDCRALQRA